MERDNIPQLTERDPAIKAIETEYAGCRFRSRLEARHAVLFTKLGLRWEYEPQGYELKSGWYLPDFRLYGVGGVGQGHAYIWFEVKSESDSHDDPRWEELSAADAQVVVAFGLPADDALRGFFPPPGQMMHYIGGAQDLDYAFCVCPACGKVGITYTGLGDRVCWEHGPAFDRQHTHKAPRILDAYRAARSARFEHGERG